MKTRLSELMDGELEKHDEQPLFDALKRDNELQGSWREYQLIGDALRGERALEADIAARVMASLRDEPVVLAPHASSPFTTWQRPALALAATVAGVAVVGWMALGQQSSQPNPAQQTLALAQIEPAAVQPVRQASRDMREYLVAHQAQSSSLQFRSGTQYIRTVAATGMTTSK